MNDKQFAKEKKRIERLFKLWAERMWLREWKIDLEIHRSEDGMPRSDRDHTPGFQRIATTHTDWCYRLATINWNAEATYETSEYIATKAMVHELYHVLVNELRENEIKHEERIVTCLTDILLWNSKNKIK